MTATLATRFARNRTELRSERPLGETAMREVAPSIFAESAHESRSARYTYIPTIDVLRGLQSEGFQPFMIAQGRCRIPGKTEFTKHMIRMRYVGGATQARTEANEVILINSHDGASSYQMLAGVFRFVCANGMVCGDVVEDVRVKHTGRAKDEVVDAAFRVLGGFSAVEEATDLMKRLTLNRDEQRIYANAAALLRFGEDEAGQLAAPVAPTALLEARRPEDSGDTLWATFQRVQENAIRGGLDGRSANGRAQRTRPVGSIDRNVSLNRALWSLTEEMRKLKASA